LPLVKKFPAFMEPESSSPYSQAPAICPYPEHPLYNTQKLLLLVEAHCVLCEVQTVFLWQSRFVFVSRQLMLVSVLHISLYDITELHDFHYVLFECTFRPNVCLRFQFTHMRDILPRVEDDFNLCWLNIFAKQQFDKMTNSVKVFSQLNSLHFLI
jgi:hypothetical protein